MDHFRLLVILTEILSICEGSISASLNFAELKLQFANNKPGNNKKNKKELINQGFVIETFFGDDNQMKNIALKKKIEFCLINKQVISIK